MDRWIEGCPQIRIKNIFVSSVEREKHTWHRFPLGVSSHSVFVFLHEPRRLADDTFSNRQSSLTLVRKCRTARTGCSNPRLSGTRGGSRFSTSLIGLQNFGTWRSSPGTTTASLTMSDLPTMDTVTTAWDRGRTGCPTTLSSSSLDLISPPYITAFKSGSRRPVIDRDMLVYWYRPHLKGVSSCDDTDNCGARPAGWDIVSDSVFVASFSNSGGSVTVKSGNKAEVTKSIGAGVNMMQFDMSAGEQVFSLSSGSKKVSGSGSSAVLNSCWVSCVTLIIRGSRR
jgi:hypothetical protein